MRYLNPIQQSEIPSQAQPLRRAAQTRVQGDVVQFAQQRAEPVRSLVKGGWQRGVDDDVPTVRMANRSARLVGANVPQLFAPMNLNRSYFIISNRSGAVVDFTFGYPTGPTGLVLNNNQSFQQMGFACATDEIWIFGAAGSFISCYEGVPYRNRPTLAQMLHPRG